MDRKNWVTLLAVAIVAVLAVGVWFALSHFTFVGGQVYPRDLQSLDLRAESLTPEDYEALAEKLPECHVVWNIPLSGGKISSDARSLTVTTLTDADVDMLDYATELKTVDGTGSKDYSQLLELRRRHPEATVLYGFTVSGVACDQDTTTLTVKGLTAEEGELLSCLPNLSRVTVTGCRDYALLQSLQAAHPQWNLSYTVALGEQEFGWDSETIRAENADCQQVAEALTALPNLKSLTIIDPQGEGAELLALREAYPQVELHWQVELYGKTLSEETTELDISGVQVASCEEVEEKVACLPNLQTLIMSDCGIDDETMAAFRERQRDNYKVVWTVTLSNRAALGDKRYIRSDATKLWSNCYYYDSELVNLKYCEDMVALDLGHTGVINLDFVSYMPELTYLIVADSGVQDLTPLSSCKKLVWLELGWCYIKSYEPLLGCTAMEDLNVGRTYADPTPISQMTWLKNLWCMDTGWRSQQLWRETLTDTNIESSGSDVVANGWRQLPNYYKMRDALGAYYMD